MSADRFVSKQLLDLYEVHEWRNGLAVLSAACESEWADIVAALSDFVYTHPKSSGAAAIAPEFSIRLDGLLAVRGWRSSPMAISETGIAAAELARFAGGRRFKTILADPPWRFENRTGKMAPEHRRLSRYQTMTLDDICALPIEGVATETAHLYLWAPNALLPEALRVMQAWGFSYKSNLVWHKVRKDGGSDGRGVGFYFRNVTELILFGVRGKNARTLAPGRSQVNLVATRKREHSRKPDEQYDIIEACSPGPYLELFARGARKGWTTWGNQAAEDYKPTWQTYAHHSAANMRTVAE